jgi:thymidylate kinase
LLRGTHLLDEHEVDFVSFSSQDMNESVDYAFTKGCLIDQTPRNHPTKIFYYNSGQKKEVHLVSEVKIFDKSRWFRIVKNNTSLLRTSKKVGPFRATVFAKVEDYILLLIHSIADKEKVSYKHIDSLKLAYSTLSQSEVCNKLSYFYINRFIFLKLQKYFFESKMKRLYFIRFMFLLYCMFNQPKYFLLGAYYRIVRFLYFKKQKWNAPKFVVVMGVDGSGKTSNIDRLIDHIGIDKCEYIHMGNKSNFLWTTKLITKLRNRKKGLNLNKSRFESPKNQAAEPNGIIKKIINLIHNLNLYLEVWTHIYWRLFKNILFTRCEYMFVDRYIYDLYKKNYHMFLFSLYPKPDYVFYLDAETDVLYKRKKEHSAQVLDEFKLRYSAFLKRQSFSPVMRIYTGNSIEESVTTIKRVLGVNVESS